MGKFKGSMIANYIDADYKKEKEWRERAKRIEQNKTIISEHLREKLIIEKREER